MKKVFCFCLATMLFLGCSSKYIGTRNEQPHKKEITKSKVALEKSYSGAAINCKLVNQQNVIEYYNKVTGYKRDASIGASVFIITGLIGAIYALCMEAPTEPQVPSGSTEYQEQWKIDYNYDAQLTAYQVEKDKFEDKRSLITTISGGSIAVGITIPLLWRGTYTKKESNSKESTNIISLNATPVEVYLDGKLYQNMVADDNGRFAVDLTPFIGNNKIFTFVFNFPSYSNFCDTLTIPASYMEKLYVERKDKEKEQEKRAYAEKVEKLINTELFKVLSFGMTLKEARKAIRDAIRPDTKDFVGIGYYFDNDSCIASGVFYKNRLHTKQITCGKNDAPDRFVQYFQKLEKQYGLPIDYKGINTKNLNPQSRLNYAYPCEATVSIWEYNEDGKKVRITLSLVMATDLYNYRNFTIYITDIEKEKRAKQHYPPHNAYDAALYQIALYQLARSCN